MEEKLKIFFCEDDENLGMLLREYLQAKGYVTDLFSDGEAGYKGFTKGKYDLCVLDVMMPKKDGLSVLKEMRRKKDSTPVILLTAKDSVEDRVAGLDAGANDYLVKPFAFEELLARVRVLLRKPEEMPKTCYTIADLEVHLDTHKVIRGKEEIRLSGKEFALLRYMVQNAGIVLSRDRLEQHLWNYDYMGSSNVIDVYIRYLRKKIDDGREKKLIHTVRGVGYVLKEEE